MNTMTEGCIAADHDAHPVLRLTSAQQSALECALLDDEDTPVVLAAWDGQGALIAEDRSRDPAERSGARGARTALQNLSTRLLAAVALP